MRLIDADKLIEDYTQPFADSYGKSCAEMFVGVVKQTPTVDIIEELEKIREEIEKYGSIWVQYSIKGHTNKDIEDIVNDVLKQAKQSFIQRLDNHIEELKGE